MVLSRTPNRCKPTLVQDDFNQAAEGRVRS
jgi:hypothetical protein